MKCCGIEEKEAAEMVALYREYYQEEGIFDNRVYDGVMEMLKTLKEAGLKIVMATSKPEKFAKMIAEHFGFAKYFDLIGGACMDGARTKKQEVIQYVLEQCKENERFCFCQYRVRTGDLFISVKNRLLLPASYYFT